MYLPYINFLVGSVIGLFAGLILSLSYCAVSDSSCKSKAVKKRRKKDKKEKDGEVNAKQHNKQQR